MKKTLFYFVLFLFVFLPFSFSLVQAQNISIERLFDIMDTDNDGKISNDEFMNTHIETTIKKRNIIFNVMDTDKDGTLSSDEFANLRAESGISNENTKRLILRKLTFAIMDTDKNEKVSNDEFVSFRIADARVAGAIVFKRVDIDSDNALNQSEFTNALIALKEKREQQQQQNNNR